MSMPDASRPSPRAPLPKAVLRELVPADRAGVDRLYRKYFSDWSADSLAQRWRWQFDDNPFSREVPARNIVLDAAGEVVGYVGALPVPIRLGGRRYVTLCGSGLVVDERYRLQAVSLLRYFASRPPFMGSSMSASARALFNLLGGRIVTLSRERFTFRLRYAGAACALARQRLRRPLVPLVQPWMFCGPAPRLLLSDAPPRQRIPALAPDASIAPLTAFGPDYEALWECVASRTPSGIERSAEYMAWRYLACPVSKADCFVKRAADGSLLGLVAGMRRAERDWVGGPCAVQGELVELMLRDPDDRATARALLLTMLHHFNALRVDSVTATGMTVALAPVLEEVGFVRSQTDDFAFGGILPPSDFAGFRPELADDWYVSGGDCENIFAVSV